MAVAANNNNDPANPPPPGPVGRRVVVVGVDLGALATKITLGPTHDHELVRNSQGGHVTPTTVTYVGPNHPRLLGEDAHDPSSSDGNTAWGLDRLLVGSLESKDNDDDDDDGEGGGGGEVLASHRRFRFDVDADSGRGAIRIPALSDGGGGEGVSLPSASVLAAFLGKVGRHAMAAVSRLDGIASSSSRRTGVGAKDGEGEGGVGVDLHFAFAVPDSYPESTRRELADAAHASGATGGSSAVDASECAAAAYRRKFSGDDGIDGAMMKERIVVVVEVGHVRSRVTVLLHGGDGGGGRAVEVLSSASSSNQGAFLVDVALRDHFLETHPKLKSEEIPRDSRRSQRLLAGCNKLKHVLSMLPEGKLAVENVGKDDADVDLSITREHLEILCKASVVDPLTSLIGKALSRSGRGVHDIDAVEVCGGGSRVPMIRNAIRDACGKDEGYVPSRSFDDSSLAFGASLVGAVDVMIDDDDDNDRALRRSKLREDEGAMQDRDVRMMRRAETRNAIEARILELRSARGGRHGDLLPSTDEFAAFLDGEDDWLFSNECDDATPQEMESRWDDVRSRTEDMCAAFYAAEREYLLEKDREMEEGARIAAAERAAAEGGGGEDGEGNDEDDHDTRRLPTKRRMEIVMKNKNEANELFSGGNYRHAAARYAKALSHAAKLFDMSPAEEDEAKEIRLSLHLNLALAYIKLEKLDNAMKSCDDALVLDGMNVKALYRRATVLYQKRKFDDAARDLDEAGRLAPEDKAVKKLRGLVDQQMAKQKMKEKAMAKKMFG